jgi:hypothetical protein
VKETSHAVSQQLKLTIPGFSTIKLRYNGNIQTEEGFFKIKIQKRKGL